MEEDPRIWWSRSDDEVGGVVAELDGDGDLEPRDGGVVVVVWRRRRGGEALLLLCGGGDAVVRRRYYRGWMPSRRREVKGGREVC